MNKLTTIDKSTKDHYVRWSVNERIQHWILAVSFIVLVITGFALKYPDSWWVRPFTGIEWYIDLRSLIHRIAGAIFMIEGVYHALYILGTRRGRGLARAFLPGIKDVRDLVQNIRYNLGLSKQAPQFEHFSYMEKAEYLALIWGGLIMGFTGLLLWFEDITLHFFPRWVIDLMTVIHLYEAWLATLAIIVWHFYYVIFNPDVYPLYTTMVDGKISDKELRHEYYLEWEKVQHNTDSVSEHQT